MNGEMIPIAQAAEILRTTPLNTLMHIKRGLLRGVENEDGWLVDCDSLEELLANSAGKVTDVCATGCAKKHACGGGCS